MHTRKEALEELARYITIFPEYEDTYFGVLLPSNEARMAFHRDLVALLATVPEFLLCDNPI
jgi:hypothetical protein